MSSLFVWKRSDMPSLFCLKMIRYAIALPDASPFRWVSFSEPIPFQWMPRGRTARGLGRPRSWWYQGSAVEPTVGEEAASLFGALWDWESGRRWNGWGGCPGQKNGWMDVRRGQRGTKLLPFPSFSFFLVKRGLYLSRFAHDEDEGFPML